MFFFKTIPKMNKISVGIVFILLSATLVAQNDKLTPESLWALGRLGLDDVSPDGQTALYGVTWYNVAANKGNRDLYTVPVSGGASRKITAFEGSEYNALYRPDGKKIGFLRGDKLWEMNPDGSDQRQVSEESMNGFAWSPAGNHILFIRDVKAGQTVQDIYPDLPLAQGRITDELMYRHWDNWDDYQVSNIFYMAYKDGQLNGQAVNIQNEPFDSPLQPHGGMEEIAWSPDGRYIAYTCKKLTGKAAAVSTNSDIYLYELSTGQTTNLSDGMPGYDREPAFSPDGRFLIWNSMERAGFENDRNRIFRYDFGSKQKEDLTVGLDMGADHPKWSADGRTIHFQGTTRGTVQLFALDTATRKTRAITSGTHDYISFAHAGSSRLIGARMSMSDPAELFRVDLATGQQTQITFTNTSQLDRLKRGKVASRTVKTTDGKEMLVWVIYPPDFDPKKKYPTLLYCQGGPQSAVSQFWSYRWNFQMMAANDYIVVAPNRRGLPGFGQAWNDEISGDWGGQSMLDLLSAIDDVKKEPYVDAARLGAVGASYGGYSVYWLAGNHNGRFKSFISHCGTFNLESWYGTTEEMFFANHDLNGPYWDEKNKASYKKHSPHEYVGKWDTPILVIHNEKDFRVPLGEGLQAFNAAQLQGIPSRFMYFPDEGHWVLKPQNGILWQRVFFDWLGKTLGEEP